MLGRAWRARRRDFCLGAVGHDFYEGERNGPVGFPRSPIRPCAGPGSTPTTADGDRAQLERIGADSFDLLLLHNPDRTGYASEVVWDGMEALREAGLTARIGVAPGPANGFTLDLIACLERFGDRIDWAMIILNPLEPWPGELCLDAAARQNVQVLTRVVDTAASSGVICARQELAKGDHRAFRPAGLDRGRAGEAGALLPIAERSRLTPIQLACQWNLAHPAVECVAPTLIQELAEACRSRPSGSNSPTPRRAAPQPKTTSGDPRDRRQHGCMT